MNLLTSDWITKTEAEQKFGYLMKTGEKGPDVILSKVRSETLEPSTLVRPLATSNYYHWETRDFYEKATYLNAKIGLFFDGNKWYSNKYFKKGNTTNESFDF